MRKGHFKDHHLQTVSGNQRLARGTPRSPVITSTMIWQQPMSMELACVNSWLIDWCQVVYLLKRFGTSERFGSAVWLTMNTRTHTHTRTFFLVKNSNDQAQQSFAPLNPKFHILLVIVLFGTKYHFWFCLYVT